MTANTTYIDISICPTDLEGGDSGDIRNERRVIKSVVRFAAARHPEAMITVQVGHRQGDKWATINHNPELGRELMADYWEAHADDDSLYETDGDDGDGNDGDEPARSCYEIGGTTVLMSADAAAAWNRGDLSEDALAGSEVCLADGDRVDLWYYIGGAGGWRDCSKHMSGMPANEIGGGE